MISGRTFRSCPPIKGYGVTLAVATLVFISFVASPSFSRDRELFLSPDITRINLAPYLSSLKDENNLLTLDQVMAMDKQGLFQPLEGVSGFGYSRADFWFKFNVTNPLTVPIDWLVEYPYAVVDYFAFFSPGPNGFEKNISGDRIPFDRRIVDFRTTIIPVQTPPGSHIYYFNIRSSGALVTPLTGWGNASFKRYRDFDTAINWLYYGVMLSTIVYCLFIYFTLKESVFFFLSVFVLGVSFFTLAHSGMGVQYFWPASPGWANLCHPLAGFLAVVGGLLFSRLFLNTGYHSLFFDRLFLGFAWFSAAMMVAGFFLPYGLLTQLSVFCIGLTVISMVICGLVTLAKGVRQARFYLLAWSPFALSALIMGVKSYGIIQSNVITDSLVQLSATIVTFFFVFGLVDKVNTYQREREAALKRQNHSEKQYRMLAENVKDVIWHLELPTFRITYITPSIYDLMGYTPEEAKKLFSFKTHLPPRDYKKVMKAIQGQMKFNTPEKMDQGDFTIALKAIRKDGSVFWTETSTTYVRDASGRAIEMIGVTRDITRRKAAEKARKALEFQLHQSGKLEAMGTLAGGIAHDMNNIMAAVLGYSELCLQGTEPGTKMHHRLTRVIKASHRARDLVQQILTFSRQESLEPRSIRVSLIVKEILSLIRASLPPSITIDLDIRDKELTVNADPTQVHQIVMNLCSNAGYAMMENGGVLGVVLDKIQVDDSGDAPLADLAPGPYVCLEVKDTGQGMKEETLERIFDPFFTTKPVGEGTGMGLSMIHGIVKNLKGAILVHSHPGAGSEFRVFLPLAGEHSVPEAFEGPRDLPGGQEEILYVDDEPDVVDVALEMLSGLGYRVTGKTSAKEALWILEERQGRVDLMITDQIMPEMSGTRLISSAREIDPGLKVILCTGYNDALKSDPGLEGVALLRKPYAKDELAVMLRQVLDKGRAGQQDQGTC